MNSECSIHNCNRKVLHRGYMIKFGALIIKLNLCEDHFFMLNGLLDAKIAYGTVEDKP